MNVYALLAVLVLAGRCSPAEAQRAATALEGASLPGSVPQAMKQIAAALSLANGTVNVSCPDCDGRGFTRNGALVDGAGRAMFCDPCDGRGYRAVTLDTGDD